MFECCSGVDSGPVADVTTTDGDMAAAGAGENTFVLPTGDLFGRTDPLPAPPLPNGDGLGRLKLPCCTGNPDELPPKQPLPADAGD